MKFNVGDWVRIRPDLSINDEVNYSYYSITESMLKLRGQAFEISQVHEDDKAYHLVGNECGWHEEWLIPVGVTIDNKGNLI